MTAGSPAAGIRTFDAACGSHSVWIDMERLPTEALPGGIQVDALPLGDHQAWSHHDGWDLLVCPLPSGGWVCSAFPERPDRSREALAEVQRTLLGANEHGAEQELAHTRMMFQSVLDTIPVRVFWKDRSGYYLGCNKLFAQDAGKASPADLVGIDDFALFPQDAELYRADDAEVMQSGHAKIDYEEPQAQTNGEDAWLQTSKIPIRGPDQQVTGILGTYADITSRKRAEAQRESLLVELGCKNAELERFTYTVSHDLKSPLVTIQGFLGVLREEIDSLDLDAATLDATGFAMHRIGEAGHHMMALLQDLLEMSRAGRTLGPRSPHDLGALAREALAQCHGPIQEAGASVEVEGPFPTVRVDGQRILQVLQNLIENACKYRSPDRVLKLTIHAEGDALVITDNGIGIPAPHRARVFELFEKLDPTTPGNGIGLALARRLVEAHGGRIDATSGPEAIGTRFQVHLPHAQVTR